MWYQGWGTMLFIVHIAQISYTQPFKNRNAELSNVATYELILFNLEAFKSQNLIQLDAFDQHYKIKLVLAETVIPSNIRHNIDPSKYSIDPYFTSLTTSCHYFGHLLSPNISSIISISICNKRGIRAQITISNETFIIKPAAYFLNRSNNISHKPTDPHIIYKLSDAPHNHIYHDIRSTFQTSLTYNQNTRRRLAKYNNGNNVVEVYILSDPAFTHSYINKEADDGDWFESLAADFVDMISWVSSEFMQNNWGSQVGNISVQLVEIEIAHDYTDIYETIQPSCFLKDTSDETISCDVCWLNASLTSLCRQSGTLSPFRTFLAQHKSLNSYKQYADFDAAFIITNIQMSKRTGAASGTLCSSAHKRPAAAICATYYTAMTIAHELGHCFDMNHDWVSGCEPVDQSLIMNYGGGGRSGFSNCSVRELQSTFAQSVDGMSCLSAPSEDSLKIVDPGDHCHGDTCVEIGSLAVDLDGIRYNYKWIAAGCDANNNHYYTAHGVNDRYLCYNKDNAQWIITVTLCNYAEKVAFCAANGREISDCTNDWVIKRAENTFAKDESVLISGCVVNDSVELNNEEHCYSDLDDILCVYDGNNKLWSDTNVEFSMMEGVCSYGKPVYQYAIYNETNMIAQQNDSGVYEAPVVLQVYYLRYMQYSIQPLNITNKSNTTVNITIAQWIISLHDITGSGEAICYKKDINECNATNWLIQNVIGTDTGSDYNVLSEIMDPLMTISECRYSENKSLELRQWQKVLMGFFVLVPAIVWLLMLFSVFFIWMKRKIKGIQKVPDGDVVAGYVAPRYEDGATLTDGNSTNMKAKCTDCGLLKDGKTYENAFYCLDCWQYYEENDAQ